MAPRFYTEQRLDGLDREVRLGSEESRHLARVLRLRQGDEAEVFDAEGNAFRVAVVQASPKEAILRPIRTLQPRATTPLRLTLAVSQIRGEPMSWLVQKATELGVERLIPFASKRTNMDPGSANSRAKRWERVSLASCKQCGRAKPMETLPPVSFAGVMEARGEYGLSLFAWEGDGALPLGEALSGISARIQPWMSALLVVGPEGGFAEEEFEAARHGGMIPVGLGPNILRTETAAIAGAAIILAWPLPGRESPGSF